MKLRRNRALFEIILYGVFAPLATVFIGWLFAKEAGLTPAETELNEFLTKYLGRGN